MVLEKNGLKIILDKDYLFHQKNYLLSYINNGNIKDLTNKKGIEISETDYEDAVERLYNLALDIMEEKLNIDIFEYLPLTKAGKFNKNNSILIATSGIKDVWNQDYFSIKMMDLKLTPVAFYNLSGESDGKSVEFELDFCNRQTGKEIPIFDGNNHPKKVEITRNKYLKPQDIKIGKTYLDAKGNKYMYLGCYREKRCREMTRDMFMHSTIYTDFCYRVQEDSEYCRYHNYIKITKTFESLLSNKNLKSVDDIFHYIYILNEKFSNLKQTLNPLKFVTDCNEQLIKDDFTIDFYQNNKYSVFIEKIN